jgi:hypothetical protein
MYGVLLDRERRALDVDAPRMDSLAELLDLIEVVPSGG